VDRRCVQCATAPWPGPKDSSCRVHPSPTRTESTALTTCSFGSAVVNLVSTLTALHPARPPGLSGHAGDQPESELRVDTFVDPAGTALDAGRSALKIRPPGSPPGWPGREAHRVRPTATRTRSSPPTKTSLHHRRCDPPPGRSAELSGTCSQIGSSSAPTFTELLGTLEGYFGREARVGSRRRIPVPGLPRPQHWDHGGVFSSGDVPKSSTCRCRG
jgi:hypothetical protein